MMNFITFICTFFNTLRKKYIQTYYMKDANSQKKKWINFLTQVNKYQKILLFLPNI